MSNELIGATVPTDQDILTTPIGNLPAAVSPQLADTVAAWQPGQTPHTRQMSLQQIALGINAIPDAPANNSAYGRMNHAWVQVLPLSGGTMQGPLHASAGFDATAAYADITLTCFTTHIQGMPNWWCGLSMHMNNRSYGAQIRMLRNDQGQNSPRWIIYANNDIETGSNSGCDFMIERYADGATGTPSGGLPASGAIDAPIWISRQFGNVQFSQNLILTYGKQVASWNAAIQTNPAQALLLNIARIGTAPSDGAQNVLLMGDANVARIETITAYGIVPDKTGYQYLGAPTRYWAGAYIENATIGGSATIGGNLTVTGTLSAGNITYTGGNVFTQVIINGAAGAARELVYQSNGSNRWLVFANQDSESGGNSGSDLEILPLDDNGNPTLPAAIEVFRSSSATFVKSLLTDNLYLPGPNGADPAGSAAFMGDINGPISIYYDGPVGSVRGPLYRSVSGTVNNPVWRNRWAMYCTADNEAGGDTGSNFEIAYYHDDGTPAGTMFSCFRANGAMVVPVLEASTSFGLATGCNAYFGTYQGPANVFYDGPAQSVRGAIYRTDTSTTHSNRWQMFCEATPEAGDGSNVGSNFTLEAYGDNGGDLGYVFAAFRANRAFVPYNLVIPNGTLIDGQGSGPTPLEYGLIGTANTDEIFLGDNRTSMMFWGTFLRPETTTQDLGQPASQWRNIYLLNNPVVSSDPVLKTDMRPLPSCVDIVRAIDPMTFRLRDDPRDKHCGFDAAQVRDVLRAAGIDTGGVVVDENGPLGLRPGELLALLWKAVQELAGDE